MRKSVLFIIGFVIILNIMLVSAGIIISQPKAVYNIGDELKIGAEVISSENGALKLNLVCDNANVNILNTRDKKDNFTIDLVSSSFYPEDYVSGDFSGLIGNCKISGKFLTETYDSQSFEISNQIELSFALANNEVEPGKEIILKGNAIKKNGEKLNGYIDISIADGTIKSKTKVINGAFEAKFNFPENTKAGSYNVNARVYEDYEGSEMNFGEKETIVYVKQVPRKIEIAIDSPTINPGETLSVSPVLYDQSGDQYPADVSLAIIDNLGNIYSLQTIKNGDNVKFELPSNISHGYWTLASRYLNIQSNRSIYINQLEKLSYDVKEGILTVTNVGNIPFNDVINVAIGNVNKAVQAALDIGESKVYTLSAPDGSYELKLNDGKEEVDFSGVALTGDAIRIDEKSYATLFNLKFIVVWMFLIAVLGMFVYGLSNKVRRTSSISYENYGSSFKIPKISFSSMKNSFKRTSDNAANYVMASSDSTPMRTASHELVMDGKREYSSLIAVRLNNLASLKHTARDTIGLIERTIIESKGTIYENGNFLIGIFTPLGTRTNENERTIARLSKKISDILEDNNKKMKTKIEYGIGLHSGELAVAKEGDKLKFTNMGSTIPFSKKIAEIAKNDVFLSENIHNKLMSELKTERANVKEMSLFRIRGINQRENYQKFMDGFARRQQQGR